jgi:hypothetical protein
MELETQFQIAQNLGYLEPSEAKGASAILR